MQCYYSRTGITGLTINIKIALTCFIVVTLSGSMTNLTSKPKEYYNINNLLEYPCLVS